MALVSQISTWNKHGTSQQLCFQKRRQLPPKKLCQFWGIHIKCVNRKKKPTWMSLTVARRKEFYLSSCKMILGHLQAQRNQDGLLLLFSETEVKWYILQNLGTGNCSHCRAVLLTVPDWWACPSCPVQTSATEDKSLERSAHWNRLQDLWWWRKLNSAHRKLKSPELETLMTPEETTQTRPDHWCTEKRNSVKRG